MRYVSSICFLFDDNALRYGSSLHLALVLLAPGVIRRTLASCAVSSAHTPIEADSDTMLSDWSMRSCGSCLIMDGTTTRWAMAIPFGCSMGSCGHALIVSSSDALRYHQHMRSS
jgi:hypothetical protein